MTSAKTYIDSQEIKGLLGANTGVLMVDRVLDIEPGSHIMAIKNCSLNEAFFSSSEQGVSELPSAMIIESLTQAGRLLLLKESELSDRVGRLISTDKLRFFESVTPGDQMRVELAIKSQRSNQVQMNAKALVDGKVVCEGLIGFQLSEVLSRPQIHPTAFVDRSAILGKDVSVGPNSIIGANVIIGDNTQIKAHCFIEKWSRIGESCQIHFGSVIGSQAQDIKYKGEKAGVIIGDRNEIREYVTINRATGKNQFTVIGSDNLLMTSVHIAHNCEIGSKVMIANMTNIAGYTKVDDSVIIGGMTGIHQFVRIGTGAMVGAYTRLPQDVAPFCICEGNPAEMKGVNVIGLRRSGVGRDTLQEIKQIYKLFFRSELNNSQAIKKIQALNLASEQAEYMIDFMTKKSKRGLTKKASKDGNEAN